jgi:zinc-binding alcohol dehydrogenase/oxidoreductase
MRALVLEQTSDLPSLIDKDPLFPKQGYAKIRLHASGWNRRDYWIIQGKYPDIKLPVTMGSDGCGFVEDCPGHPNLIGQEVIICPSLNWGSNPEYQSPDFHILGMPSDGTFAEEVLVPVENIFQKPEHLSEEKAAALPLAGLTAWRSVFSRAKLKKGEDVLITGIGGSTAIFAMQFALAIGANVFVTSSSPEKIKNAINLGAKGGVLYTSSTWGQECAKISPKGFDVIIDSAGGEGFKHILRLLGMGGRLVFFGGTQGRWPSILPQYLFFKQVSIFASTMGTLTEFQQMLAFITKHKIEPVVDSVFALEDYAKAIERLTHKERFGKVVLQID